MLQYKGARQSVANGHEAEPGFQEGIRVRNIVLIGMPGTGKSTVGQLLARRLNYQLIDTDRRITAQSGKSLPEIIAANGVEGLLMLESEVGQTLDCDHCVIATGGSMVLSEAAMEHLRTLGVVVWLDTPLPELRRRIRRHQDRGIAAAPGVTLRQIDTMRRPLYQRYADFRVASARSVKATAEQILTMLRQDTGSEEADETIKES